MSDLAPVSDWKDQLGAICLQAAIQVERYRAGLEYDNRAINDIRAAILSRTIEAAFEEKVVRYGFAAGLDFNWIQQSLSAVSELDQADVERLIKELIAIYNGISGFRLAKFSSAFQRSRALRDHLRNANFAA